MQIARWTAAVVITIPLLAAVVIFAGVAAGAPEEHAVTTPGAEVVKVEFPTGIYEPRSGTGSVAPTTSLDQFRCEVWQQDPQQACPASDQLAISYWPDVLQQPDTLYLGVMTSCGLSREHLDAEYLRGTLPLHCHCAAPWWRFERAPSGAQPQGVGRPSIELLVLNTANVPHGQVNVVFEERAERWFQDAVVQRNLGHVTIG